MSLDRTVVAVEGADALLADIVDAAAAGTQLSRAAAVLVAGGPHHDLREASARSAGEGRGVVLARHGSGAVLVAKWFAPGNPTSIHANGGWGVALVVSGIDRYERWVLLDDLTVSLVEARDLAGGECAWWGEPPQDIHRQEGLGDGALELIVVGAEPSTPLTEYRAAADVDGERRAPA